DRSTLTLLVKGAADPSSLLDVINQASTGRWHIWRNTLAMIGDQPWLGRGPASFRFDYPAYAHRNAEDPFSRWNRWLTHPQNELLNQWVEVGSLGLLAVLMAVAGVLSHAATGSHHRVGERRWIGTTALIGLVIGVTCSMFDTGASISSVRLMLALYVAAAITSGEEQAAAPLRPFSRTVASISLAVLVLGEAAFVFSQWATVRSRTSTTRAEQLEWARLAATAAPVTLLTGRTYAAALESIRPGLGGPTYLDLAARYDDVPLALYSGARAELERGRPDAARELLERAVLRDPSMTEASQLLRILRDGVSPTAP
ncbi:MAG: O-antigen ligase family protein, partial [Deltaproteobacteria bacterium]|nr:O-antigen ligase family protein [Deltaproteobacteria bacterium]